MGETLERGAETHTTCSECGWGTPDAKREAALWPRLVLWIVPLVVAGVAVATSFLIPSRRTTVTWHATQLTQPMVTRGDLRRMAAGEEIDRDGEHISVVSTLLKRHYHNEFRFGSVRFQAMLVTPPHGSERTSLGVGWPLVWAYYSVEQRYENIVAHEGSLTAASYVANTALSSIQNGPNPDVKTGPKLSFFGAFWILTPEWTGGKIIEFSVMFPFLIVSLAVALAGGLTARWLAGKLLRSRITRDPRVARRSYTFVGAIVFTAILLFPSSHAFLSPNVGFAPSSGVLGSSTLQPGAVLTGISVDELHAFVTVHDADQALAADILSKLGDGPDAAAADVLLAGECMEFMPTRTDVCDSLMLMFAIMAEHVTFERCPDFGVQEAVTMPPTNAFGFEDGFLTYLHASGVAGVPVLRLGVYPPGVLAGAAICMVPGLIPFLLHRRHVRRRGDKRLRANQCPWCTYPLGAGASEHR